MLKPAERNPAPPKISPPERRKLVAIGVKAGKSRRLPAGRDQPDPAVFSLNEMTVEIRIDNGIARVATRQIFGNHSPNVREGTYIFALPAKASVSDFAVWDDVTRIPGVNPKAAMAARSSCSAKALKRCNLAE